MAADNALTVTITANTGDAVAGVSSLETRLAALEKAYTSTTVATNTHAAATSKSTIETRVATEAATGLTGALDALGTHYRLVASGAEVFGLETTAAAGKVAAFTEVIEGLEAACAPLLIALVALEVVFKSFEYLKDAAEAAATMQSQIETLGAAVNNQGGNWDAMSAAVSQWIDQESMASGILRSELIPALNELVTAGNSVADSEKILAVAEEVAVAKHRDVKDIVELLISAESGRGQGLVKLDGNLKAVVSTHGLMSQGLQILHNDFKNQIEDGDSAERTFSRLKVELEGVSLVIGDKLLPFLTNMGYWFLGAIPCIADFGNSFVDTFKSIGESIQAAGSILGGFAKATDDFQNGRFSLIGGDFQSGFAAAAAHNAASQKLADRGAAEFGSAGQDWDTRGRHIAGAAVNAHAQHVGDLSLDKDGRFGNAPKGRGDGTSTVSFAESIAPTTNYDAIADAQKGLTTQIAAMNDREAELKASVGNATTELQKQTLQAALDAQVTSDLAAKKKLLGDAMDHEVLLNQQLGAQLKVATTAASDATAAYNKFGESAANDGTIQAQNHLSTLKQTMDDADAKVTALGKSIKENTDNFTTNSSALQANTVATIANGNATAALALAKSIALSKALSDWDAYYAKSEQDMANDMAVAKMTNAQKFQYYKQLVDNMAVTDDASLKIREGYLKDELSAYKATVDEQAKDYQKYIDDATKQTSSFIDAIVIDHKSLSSELKSVYDDILKNYVDMIAKMIVQSSIFKNTFPFSGGATPGAGAGGVFGSLTSLGGGSGASTATYTAGALNVHVQNVGPAALDGLTGSSTGVSPGSPTAAANTTGLFAVGAADGVGGVAASAATKSISLSGLVGGAASGAALGSMDLGGGNAQGSQIGGLLGGVLGVALHANPLIGAGIDVASSLIGSLFGPKDTFDANPQNQDANYNQDLANWQGIYGYGTAPANQFYTANGGVAQNQQISKMLDTTDLSTLTAAQQAVAQQLIQLNGGTTGDNLTVTSNHQDNLTFASGAQTSVANWSALISQYQSLFGDGSAGSTPTFAISRPYPNANSSTSTQNGTIPNGGIPMPTINVTIQGNLVGEDGMTQLTTILSENLFSQQRGTLPIAGGGSVVSNIGGS